MEYKKLGIIKENSEDNIKERKLCSLTQADLTNAKYIEIRAFEEFAYRAFFLNPGFEWKLGKDSQGSIILVPIRRKY